MTNISF